MLTWRAKAIFHQAEGNLSLLKIYSRKNNMLMKQWPLVLNFYGKKFAGIFILILFSIFLLISTI